MKKNEAAFKLAGIFAIMTLFLIQFQNCAPVSPINGAIQNIDGEVRVIDDWNADSLLFFSKTATATPNVSTLNIDGFCNRKAKNMEVFWYLIDPSQPNLDISQGVAYCNNGAFRVSVNTEALQCNKTYSLMAGFDGVKKAEISVRRPCIN
ncbi:MAG: hypothetical protein D6797_00390 [Bdellovibrio sp.]|nr:MAG: hypothetical protein D6797_00390 [Bdellovibrio sp.]